jgi:hypothetical protein
MYPGVEKVVLMCHLSGKVTIALKSLSMLSVFNCLLVGCNQVGNMH